MFDAGFKRRGDWEVIVPIIHTHNYHFTSPTQVRTNRIFGIYSSQYPSSTVEIHTERPSTIWLLSFGYEYSYIYTFLSLWGTATGRLVHFFAFYTFPIFCFPSIITSTRVIKRDVQIENLANRQGIRSARKQNRRGT